MTPKATSLPTTPPASTLNQAANIWRRDGPVMDHTARVGILLKLARKLFPDARLQRKADGTTHIVIPKETP